MKRRVWKFGLAVWVAALALGAPPPSVGGQELTFKIPPVKIPVAIANQPIAITASGIISRVAAGRGENVFRLELVGDLSDLQLNITEILRSQLDRSERCGERIAIQNATLTPMAPASLVVSRLHVERWTCVKVFGKERPNKLVGGNGTIEIKLTPAVEEDSTLRLVADVGRIEAEGPLGELLLSGSIGAAIREKITKALLAAMQKGTNFKATLPPVAQDYAKILNAQFRDGGSGNLDVVLDGEIRISNEQIKLLANQLKERLSSQGIPPQQFESSHRFCVPPTICAGRLSPRAQVLENRLTAVPLKLLDLARRYTAAWCSQDPERVAAFYSPTGSLRINGGAPAVGRSAITETARGFMTAFPDLRVLMDDLVPRGGGAVYRWTLLGTNSGPGGNGQRVRISGFEEWTIGADGLIAESLGSFDEADYQRQLAS